MNPTAVYDDLAREFPPVHSEDHEWVNVHDGQAPNLGAMFDLVEHHIPSPEVVVVVHCEPGVAAVLPKADVVGYVAGHVLKHEIQMSDPLFNCFVAVSRSGVATGWRKATQSTQASRQGDA